MALSSAEKEDLLEVIRVLFGHSAEIARRKNVFNPRTLEVVEHALEALMRSNASMRNLVMKLLGDTGALSSGWLRNVLANLRRELESNRIKFDGLASRVAAATNWKSAVIISTHSR